MSTTKEVHIKILEISKKYLSGHPQIHINSIAEELGITKDRLTEQITTLKNLNLIEFIDPGNDMIVLTDFGKFASLDEEGTTV